MEAGEAGRYPPLSRPTSPLIPASFDEAQDEEPGAISRRSRSVGRASARRFPAAATPVYASADARHRKRVGQLLIQSYYNDISRLKQISGSKRESVVREAFKDLLKAWGKSAGLTFIPEHEVISTARDRNYVDGALLQDLRVPFGYWEAKDEDDDLDKEIAKKFRRGYPKSNIVFEDTVSAVLIQNGKEVIRCPMEDAERLGHLLKLFFEYEPEAIRDFRKAIAQFKMDLPAVLDALRERIDAAYESNKAFADDAGVFLRHAKETINPAISEADIREMLIQHILTEDIFARVFENPDFHRENNVAKALDALEKQFFRGAVKQETLKGLEPYYAAIRSTAALISSHAEKQGFLKGLYENFYKVYNPKAADRLGVVYTPNEIVRFMIESADWLCEKHFGKRLIDRNVEILDPATGTGTFIVELLEHFRGQPSKLKYKYENELHANEVAILPYYVANLNIEATYAAITKEYAEFPNLCFVDTLDNVAALGIFSGHQHELFGAISDENVERVKRQNQRKISVIIGNPPYNAWQENYNQKNPNRPYRRVDQRIQRTYVKEGTAQNKNSVYDMYTRFVRWASDRIGEDGIISFIVGRKPFAKGAYDGFRKVAAREFAEIVIIDLGGDVRDNPKISGTKHNVFGIQTGVAIALFVRKKGHGDALIRYARRPESETREDKLAFLGASGSAAHVSLQTIQPDRRNDWLDQAENDWNSLMPIALEASKREQSSPQERTIFRLLSNGLKTQRDDWVYDFDRNSLAQKVQFFVLIYESTRKDPKFADREAIKWDAELARYALNPKPQKRIRKAFSDDAIVKCAFRPFCDQWVYLDEHFNGRTYRVVEMFPDATTSNQGITFRGIASNDGLAVFAADRVFDLNQLKTGNGTTAGVSRYRYVGKDRLDNITDWALAQFTEHYGAKAKITKDAIFAYVYGVLHDPVYREKYALNLKREFPRIPFYRDFKKWRDWGQRLLDLHIHYEKVELFPLKRLETLDMKSRAAKLAPPPKLKSDRDKGHIILDTETTLSGVPPEAWDYRLGNRSAIDWVLDQHKEKKPRDKTVAEKFNTYRFADYKEKVVDLLMRVTTVSVETMKIVEAMKALPASARDVKEKATA